MNKILLSLGVAALLCGGSAIIAPDSNSASAAEQTQAAPAKAAKTAVYTLKDGSKVTVATFEDGSLTATLADGTVAMVTAVPAG